MENFKTYLAPVKLGVLFSLLTILVGFGFGTAFGIAEEPIKGHLLEKATSVVNEIYGGDIANADKVLSKSWVYFKRAHMHAGALGTTSLVVCVLVAFWGIRPALFKWLTAAMGLGSLGYSIFWCLAGLRAPLLGSTGAAKESLAFLAMPSVAFLSLSLLTIALFWVFDFFFSSTRG